MITIGALTRTDTQPGKYQTTYVHRGNTSKCNGISDQPLPVKGIRRALETHTGKTEEPVLLTKLNQVGTSENDRLITVQRQVYDDKL